ELLLCAVVEVAFELPALLVLRRHETLTGRPELGDESHVPEHESGLGREIADQLVLGGIHRIRRRHPYRERAEELPAVTDLDGVFPVDARQRVCFDRERWRFANVSRCRDG